MLPLLSPFSRGTHLYGSGWGCCADEKFLSLLKTPFLSPMDAEAEAWLRTDTQRQFVF